MAELVKMSDKNEPSLMTIVSNGDELVYASINLNIECVDNLYIWDALVLPDFALENIHNAEPEMKRSVLIAHIVKGYYNDNDMAAILNNYLSDMTNEKYKAEFNDLQKIRKIAKEIGTHIVANKLF
jgi:hypothetical protein